jgi:hypothetical protein
MITRTITYVPVRSTCVERKRAWKGKKSVDTALWTGDAIFRFLWRTQLWTVWRVVQQRSCFLLFRAAVPFGILCGWNDATALYMLRQFPFVQVCYHTSVCASQVCVRRLWSSSRAGTVRSVKWMGCGLINPQFAVRIPGGAHLLFS